MKREGSVNFSGTLYVDTARTVSIELDARPLELLKNLVKTGLFGETIEEVAASLILEGLRKACTDQFLIVPRV